MGTPRVLVLTSTFPARLGDGVPAFVADLSNELARDYDVRILAPAVPGGAPRERLSERVEVVRYRYFPRRWEDLADGAILENARARRSRMLQVPFLLGGMARALRRHLRDFQPELIHSHWIVPQGIVVRRFGRRTPYIVTTLGGDLYALNSKPWRRLKSDVLRHASAVTVMNEDMRERAVALGADPEVTSVLPMGARLATLDEAVQDKPRATGPLRILAVGRLVQKKGFDVLLAALRRVDFDYELEIVGDGPERTALERLATGMPVVFAGQLGRDALAQSYLGADLAVFPSRRAESGDQDGLPVALLEAMGAGCAIVASDLPGLNEAIEPGQSGELVAENDEGALIAALSSLAGNEQARLALGAAARRRAAAYSVEAIGERYRALFSHTLAP